MHFSRRYFIAVLAGFWMTGAAFTAQAADTPHVLLKTNMGEIVLELYPEKAPKTVENFLQYVKSGHYSGTVFHRVIENFMIQGGGFDKDMNQKPTRAPIENEAKNGLKNETYTLAMARLPSPHSASAQFFINTNNNAGLDYPGQDGWGYCVFGKVIKGMDVVDKIKLAPVADRGMNQAVPIKPIVIESATLTK
jgi:cyclophilin family peptidyl-prolyl cis-trans isomerase